MLDEFQVNRSSGRWAVDLAGRWRYFLELVEVLNLRDGKFELENSCLHLAAAICSIFPTGKFAGLENAGLKFFFGYLLQGVVSRNSFLVGGSFAGA